MALKARSATMRRLKVLLAAFWDDGTCGIAAKRWAAFIQQNGVLRVTKKDAREFCPVEATVFVIGSILLAILDCLARDGIINVWKRFWLF
jgi:hypothetical protein